MRLFDKLPGQFLCVIALLAIGGCASEPFYDAAPIVPANVSPVEEADIQKNARTTFIWRASDTALYYEFHIFNQSTKDIQQYYRSNLQASDVCNGGSCQLTMNVDLPVIEDHAWRVRAANNAGFSNWSRTRFNMVGAGGSVTDAPAVPDPLQPLSGSSAKANSLVDFVWRAVPDATSYDFHLFDSENRTMVDVLTNIPATTVCQSGSSCQLTRKINLPAANDHAWRIRAINNAGQSAWTRVTFAVEP